jgi:hypothetical protein
MKESYGEGLATHTGPESCAGDREAVGEALTGVSAGSVLSREIIGQLRGADAVECVFRTNAITDSGGRRSLIPAEAYQPINILIAANRQDAPLDHGKRLRPRLSRIYGIDAAIAIPPQTGLMLPTLN